MAHKPGCEFWDPTCERCSTMLVADLDNEHFTELMGCSRGMFDTFLMDGPLNEVFVGQPDSMRGWLKGEPKGLQNFYSVIMHANALQIYKNRQVIIAYLGVRV